SPALDGLGTAVDSHDGGFQAGLIAFAFASAPSAALTATAVPAATATTASAASTASTTAAAPTTASATEERLRLLLWSRRLGRCAFYGSLRLGGRRGRGLLGFGRLCLVFCHGYSQTGGTSAAAKWVLKLQSAFARGVGERLD